MGRPKTVNAVLKKIDKKLWDYIGKYSKKHNINNYRKASEELTKWLEDLERRHKL